jgi:arginine exporter protein ArgO
MTQSAKLSIGRYLAAGIGLVVVVFLVLAHFNPGAALDLIRPLLGDWANQTLPKEFFWIFPSAAAALFVFIIIAFRKKA